MKKSILFIISILLGTVSQIESQPIPRMEFDAPGVQSLIIRYGDELKLSNDQKNELIELQINQKNRFQAYNRPVDRDNRNRFKNERRGRSDRGSKNRDRGLLGSQTDARMEMRNEILSVLTDNQRELLKAKMTEQAERAHEFRTFRHEYIVKKAGIEGDKTEQVLSLLHAQSVNRLELAKQYILNPEEVNRNQVAEHFQKLRDTNDEFRKILTVDEYENLRQNLGFTSGNHPQRNLGMERGYRMWNR